MLVLENDETGSYLVAESDQDAGVVLRTETAPFTSAATMHSIQYDKSRHANLPEDGMIRFTAHLCDPCCCIELKETDVGLDVSLVTTRPVKRGERLGFDYCTTELDMSSPFTCKCGAAQCRGQIQGFSFLNEEEKAALNASTNSRFQSPAVLAQGPDKASS